MNNPDDHQDTAYFVFHGEDATFVFSTNLTEFSKTVEFCHQFHFC